MRILFIDTNCEVDYQTAKELGITNIIQMPYTICDKEYFYDLGEHYDSKWFFDLLRDGNIPITSALNAENYKEYFEPFFKNGDDILYLSFSDKMSGTFNYMNMVVKELSAQYPKATFVRFDTKAISMSAGLAIIEGSKLFKQGLPYDEIISKLDALVPKIQAFLIADDLNHLKRGGRLTSSQAFFGTLLGIKPIIKLTKEGTLAPMSKVPGRRKAIAQTITEVSECIVTDYPLYIMQADCFGEADEISKKIKEKLPNLKIVIQAVGPVIGTHCGPNTLAFCFVGKNDRPNQPKI